MLRCYVIIIAASSRVGVLEVRFFLKTIGLRKLAGDRRTTYYLGRVLEVEL